MGKPYAFLIPLSLLIIAVTSGEDSTPENCERGDGYCMAKNQKKEKEKHCELTPFSYEGPFFLPNQPVREDIREGKPGVAVGITFEVRNTSCHPVEGVQVHVWQCDAMGVYSAYSKYYPFDDPNAWQVTHPHSKPSEDATFLRGIQTTNSQGQAKFTTIYPGWYTFRALHIHFKITTADGKDKYTGEIYFPDELTDEIAKVEPYKSRHDMRKKNSEDRQFVNDHGEYLVMKPSGNVVDGLEGTMTITISK